MRQLYLVATIIFVLFLPSTSFNPGNCTGEFFEEAVQRLNTTQLHCHKKSLRTEFAWTFDNATRLLDAFFGATLDFSVGWIAWGLNLGKEPQMVGTRALIGIMYNDTLSHGKYNITGGVKRGCALRPTKTNFDLNVTKFNFRYYGNIDYYVIEATIFLPLDYNVSRANIVWQVGQVVVGEEPKMHGKSLANFDSVERIDLINGTIHSARVHKINRWRNIHGIMSMVGWGTMLPIGVLIARYFRTSNTGKRWRENWWREAHLTCQIFGYLLGTVAWFIGIYLGNTSKHYYFRIHRIFGIVIFTAATLQILAFTLKPKGPVEEWKNWNIYHHFLGYTILALVTFNILKGISILNPYHGNWKVIYIAVIGTIASAFVLLEIYSWVKFFKNKLIKWLDERVNKQVHQMGSTNNYNAPAEDPSRSDNAKSSSTDEDGGICDKCFKGFFNKWLDGRINGAIQQRRHAVAADNAKSSATSPATGGVNEDENSGQRPSLVSNSVNFRPT